MGRDDRFRMLEGIDVQKDADAVLAEFDDIAIFVIFSAFEAIVRDRVVDDVESEVSGLRHVALRRSAKKLLRDIEEGSFSNNVLDLFKRDGSEPGSLDVNSLVEEVGRVRRYRNWVAHGRRPEKKPPALTPRDAFDIMGKFLADIAYKYE